MIWDFEEKPHIYTVSEVNSIVKSLVEGEPEFHNITVEGEISDWKIRGEHAYFILKDEDSTMSCVMFGAIRRLRHEIRDGFHVFATGDIRVYERRGIYQLYCHDIKIVSKLGILYQRFEELKRKLKEEGVFEKKKKEIPRFPKRIGVVTSRDSAALRDILKVINRRYPLVEIFLFHTSVQGEDAKYEIVKALEMADKFHLDVIILARGGGSIEDLWPFNEEIVVRKLREMRTPIITGVGHEIDVTLVDYVADERKPTPTAAASTAVPDGGELRRIAWNNLRSLHRMVTNKLNLFKLKLERMYSSLEKNSPFIRLERMMENVESKYRSIRDHLDSKLNFLDLKLRNLQENLKRMNPLTRIEKEEIRLKSIGENLKGGISKILDDEENSLNLIESKLNSMKPGKPLLKGYTLVKSKGRIITRACQLEENDEMEIKFVDGTVVGRVEEVQMNEDQGEVEFERIGEKKE